MRRSVQLFAVVLLAPQHHWNNSSPASIDEGGRHSGVSYHACQLDFVTVTQGLLNAMEEITPTSNNSTVQVHETLTATA